MDTSSRFGAARWWAVTTTMALTVALMAAHSPAQDAASSDGETPAGTVGLRHPAISPDGSEIAFSYRGDIWVAPVAGGTATRITATDSCEEYPAWHPLAQGLILAFTADDRGTQDIYMSMRNGERRTRLTAHGSDDARPAYSPDGQWIYFQSRRDSNLDLVANESLWDIWRIAAMGGTAERVTYFRGQAPAVHGSGEFIAFDRYGSGYADGEHDIHIVGARGGVPKTVASARDDQRMAKFAGDTLFFISNANGVHHNRPIDNLWGCPAKGGAHHQITNFHDGHITGLSVSADGKFAIIERDYRLYRVEIADGKTTPIAITIPGTPYAAREAELLTAQIRGRVGETAILPMPASGDSPARTTALVAFGGALRHIELPADLKTFEAENAPVAEMPVFGESFGLEPPTWPEISADGKWLVVCEGEGAMQSGTRLSLVELATGKKSTLAEGENYRGPAFARDGVRVAFTVFTDEGSRIDEVNIATGERRTLVAPDGRESIPLYPQYLPGDGGVLVVISRPSGQGYSSRIVQVKADGERVEFEIEHRGLIRHLQLSPDGTRAVFAAGRGRQGDRLAILDVATQKVTPIESRIAVSFPRWMGDSRLLATAGGERAGLVIFDLPTNAAPTRHFLAVKTTRQLSRTALMAETFDRTWDAFRVAFYDPFLHGVDWAARGAHYRPMAAQCSTTRELYDLLARMILELDSSHVHVELPPTAVPKTGMPGWDVEPATMAQTFDEGLIVRDVIPNGPADNAGIKVGDQIVRVNGVHVSNKTNVDELLTKEIIPAENASAPDLLENDGRNPFSEPDPNWTCEVEIRGAEGQMRTVTVGLFTRTQIRQLRYQNQIEWRKAFVKARSKGRLAYHHIQTMLSSDLREFMEAIPTLRDEGQALVLDIRDGIGGNIHHALSMALDSKALERLRDRPACYVRDRGRESNPDGVGGPYFFSAQLFQRFGARSWDRPSICVMNNICRSDKEIFPHLYRHLGLGTLVGESSARGVIGSGYVDLPDGGKCMMSYNVFFTCDGANMEGSGVDPDIRVDETLADLYAGRDRQLETAIDTLLAQLDGHLAFPDRHTAENVPALDRPMVPRRAPILPANNE